MAINIYNTMIKPHYEYGSTILRNMRNTQYSIELSVHKQPRVFKATYTIQSRVNCPNTFCSENENMMCTRVADRANKICWRSSTLQPPECFAFQITKSRLKCNAYS